MNHDRPPPPPVENGDPREPQAESPITGAPIVDGRAEFEGLTARTPGEPAAEQDFIKGKIDMVRSDPNLTEEEKAAAIEELKKR
jgi:hypothetical protein